MTRYNDPTGKKFTAYEALTGFSVILMFVGFMFARAALSVGMILLLAAALWPSRIALSWRRFKGSVFAWCSLFFFIAYALSGFWSSDGANWQQAVQIKLPFAILPFAMLQVPLHRHHLFRLLIHAILLVMLAGMLYSVYYIIQDPAILRSGRHFLSPAQGDYIRFTIALVLGLQLGIYLLTKQDRCPLARWEIVWIVAWCVLAILYIHLQAAKSGLLCLYAFFGWYLCTRIFRRYGLGKTVGILLVGALFFVIAVNTVPPVQHQMARLVKEKQIWESGDTARYRSVSSVVPRLISYEAAMRSISEHPWLGVGAGDLERATQEQYRKHFPFMKVALMPHNQFLCSAVTIGVPMTLFLVFLVVASIWRQRRVFPLAAALTLVLGLMIDPMLEVQYGVFVYLFFTLLWMARHPGSVSAGNLGVGS